MAQIKSSGLKISLPTIIISLTFFLFAASYAAIGGEVFTTADSQIINLSVMVICGISLAAFKYTGHTDSLTISNILFSVGVLGISATLSLAAFYHYLLLPVSLVAIAAVPIIDLEGGNNS